MDSHMWDERYSGSDLVWSSAPNQWVEQFAVDLSPGRALDLGGGEGRNALWLAERGWRATVVDFSPVALDRAAALASQRLGPDWAASLATVCADLLTYQPPLHSFDLVVVAYLQVAAQARRTALRIAASAVAEGGYLLVVAHDSANLKHGVGGPQDPTVLYTANDAAADISGTGLVVARSQAVLRAVAADQQAKQAIDALLVARREPRPSHPRAEPGI